MADLTKVRRLMSDLETDRVERKQSASDTRKISEAICGMSNDLANHGEPGYIMVGLRDDGSCAGLAVTDDLLLNIAHLRSSGQILPIPIMSVDRVEVDGCKFVVIEVSPHPLPPVRFEGRTFIRVGPRRAIATVDEERMLSERQRSNVRSFDQSAVAGAAIADLNLERFIREYLPFAVSREALARNGRSPEDQLRAVRMLSNDGYPNLAAVLSLADDPRRFVPGAYIQFVRYDGDEVFAPIVDEKEIDGPLASLLTSAEDLVKANISTAIDFTSGTLESSSPDYPIVAIQQLLRNAIMHRNYESSNAPTKVYWFANRIEVHNPGGLYGQVNEANFGRGVSDYRNPAVAEAMKTLGFVQRFGIGIAIANKALVDNGSQPATFDFTPSAFVAIVYAK